MTEFSVTDSAAPSATPVDAPSAHDQVIDLDGAAPPFTPPPPKRERPADLPKSWSIDDAELWNSLAPEARQRVRDRENARDKHIDNLRGESSQRRQEVEQQRQVVEHQHQLY